jgi:hypothetical protein
VQNSRRNFINAFLPLLLLILATVSPSLFTSMILYTILMASVRSYDLIEIESLAVFADVRAAGVRVVDFMAADLFISLSPIKSRYSCVMFKCQDCQATEVTHRIHGQRRGIAVEMF